MRPTQQTSFARRRRSPTLWLSLAFSALCATWLHAERESDAQRAPLLVVSSRALQRGPGRGSDDVTPQLRLDDSGSFSFEGRSGRLSAAQMRTLRSARARVRWRAIRPQTTCDALPDTEQIVRSFAASARWSSPCGTVPDPTIPRFVAQVEAMLRASAPPPRGADAATPPTDATAQSATQAPTEDPRACAQNNDCVLACPEVAGCCGHPCGCTTAINRSHLPRITEEYARTCQRPPRCPEVACAVARPRIAACVDGRCRLVP